MSLILNKYIIDSPVETSNYFPVFQVIDEIGDFYYAQRLTDISRKGTVVKNFLLKLKFLKQSKHSCLPKLIEYGWEESENAYFIIYQIFDAPWLESKFEEISPKAFLDGVRQLVDCLQDLLVEYRITHGDITPMDIFIDDKSNFRIINFGQSDLAKTLNLTREISDFSERFVAPEKREAQQSQGFPFQKDVYSIGKVIDWYFAQNEIKNTPEVEDLINSLCEDIPRNRPTYNKIIELLNVAMDRLPFSNESRLVVSGANEEIEEILADLNDATFQPFFNLSNNKGDDIFLNIATRRFKLYLKWIPDDTRLHLLDMINKEEERERYTNIIKYGTKLPISVQYISEIDTERGFDLSNFLDGLKKEKTQHKSYKALRESVSKKLSFYEELLKKEVNVLEKNSLRVEYSRFDKKADNEIWFKLRENDKYSIKTDIERHLDLSSPPHPKEFEYEIRPSSDRKSKRDVAKLSGIAYDYSHDKGILKFKDCERLDFSKIPNRGYLFQDIRKEKEEKKRQQDAIGKTLHNDTQNPKLMNALFEPSSLKSTYSDITELKTIYQKDKKGQPFRYSPNQTQAIIKALECEPLTVIQGPPGTGKTTVITEIVFQILAKDPHAKILITSQTNDAVNNVLENLLENEISIVRLSGIRRPEGILRKHTLENKTEGWKREISRRAKENFKVLERNFRKEIKKDLLLNNLLTILMDKGDFGRKKSEIEKATRFFNNFKLEKSDFQTETSLIQALDKQTKIGLADFFMKRELHIEWLKTIKSVREDSKLNQKLIDSIRVIGATTNHIASGKYRKFNFAFDYVIMDESGKATIAESLIPLTMADRAVLVGDHRQLRPMLTSEREVENWLREKYKKESEEYDDFEEYFNRPSLFEEVIEEIDDDFKSQLETCRRCSAEQVKLISECFYEAFGDEKIEFVQRSPQLEHNLPLKRDGSIFFFDIGNANKSSRDNSKSSYNEESAELVCKILADLDKYEKTKEYSIGVIAGYKAQVRRIKRKLRGQSRRNLKLDIQQEISVVDKFQGIEKDIIIFDLVRSNQGSIGFLANPNRINVALSRQKKLLIIVGNYDWLLTAPSPKYKEKVALQMYLDKLDRKSIIKETKDLF